MPFDIHVRSAVSTVAEDAAVKTAFDTFIAAVKAATAHHVDAGGSVINGKPVSADELSSPHGRGPGGVW